MSRQIRPLDLGKKRATIKINLARKRQRPRAKIGARRAGKTTPPRYVYEVKRDIIFPKKKKKRLPQRT